MVVAILACISASISTPVQGQEFSPNVNDRVDDGLLSASRASQNNAKTSGLDLGFLISTAYDDNVFLSRNEPVRTQVFYLAPAIAYTKGDADEGEGGFVQFAYRPTAVIYTDSEPDDRIDQVAALKAGWRGKVTQIIYTGAITKRGDATADTGQQTERVEFSNEIRTAWTPREKFTFEVAAVGGQSDYKNPALFDFKRTYAEIAVRYAYSPKTELAAAYQIGRFDFDGASEQTTHQVTGGIDWKPREKIRVQLRTGVERRDSGNESFTNPVLQGRVDWNPRQGTNLYLTAYQRLVASAFFANQTYQLKGVTAGFSQRIGNKLTARLEAGREIAEYSDVSGSAGNSRNDALWFVRPALEYQINKECNVSLYYRASSNSSNYPEFGYRQNITGLELNYKF
jgi:hypothetical protein